MTSQTPDAQNITGRLSPRSSGDQAIYVYAFVDSSLMNSLPRLPDADRPILLHHAGGISAVIDLVQADSFRGPEGERNMADPAWIMPRIRYHESVVEGVMERSPVYPTRFATLYTSFDSLTQHMGRHEIAISHFLRQVTGQREWAVTVTAELDDLKSLESLAIELWPAWSGISPGTRYLRLRQERSALLSVARERIVATMPDIVDTFRPCTTAIRTLVRHAATRDPGHQRVADYALLTPVLRQEALRERLSGLAADLKRRGLHIALSGPWPPYSFRPLLDGTDPAASRMSDSHPILSASG
jgi:hypothetical protein